MTSIYESLAAIIIVLAVCAITDIAIVIVARYLAPRRPTILKVQRFESGNPPLSIPKYVLMAQYMPYLLLFLACEPIFVLLLVLAVSTKLSPTLYSATLGIVLLITLPLIYLAYKLSVEVAYSPEKRVRR